MSDRLTESDSDKLLNKALQLDDFSTKRKPTEFISPFHVDHVEKPQSKPDPLVPREVWHQQVREILSRRFNPKDLDA